MLEKSVSTGRRLQVVFIDHSYLHQIGWVEKFAKSSRDIKVILLTDKSPSRVEGLFEIVNVHDVKQKLELTELQKKYNFSLYRALVAERAFFDYTTFNKYECYSRVTLDDVDKLVRPHVNALDEVIQARADLVFGHLADNAIASLAANIAAHYGKPYAAAFPYYWWTDGLLFVDRPEQTSSEVDEYYRHFYANQHLIDRDEILKMFLAKRVSHQYSDATVYPLWVRIKKVLASRKWHEPFSLLNWVLRRLRHLVSQLAIRFFARALPDVPRNQRYILFPLHIAPEASLLGSTPELADQFSLIKNISINLPWGVKLCVKKHPGQKKWTGPGYDFFRKLRSLANVEVIDATASIGKILDDENCRAVVTINGTVGLEAAMKRKPVFVFGQAIYGVANCFMKPKNFKEFRDLAASIDRGEFVFDEGAMFSILAAMDKSVWHGDHEFALEDSTEKATLKMLSLIERYIHSEKWRRNDLLNYSGHLNIAQNDRQNRL